MRNKKIELLSPAGGIKHLHAAVENGADAVYFGGSRYSARAGAENFDMDQIREAVRYAHPRGVKLYAAVNTLLYDDEIPGAFSYAADLYEAGVDALIIQDLGLAYLIKKYIPDFHIHLSTQGTVYNLSGAKTAARLGFSRVVPARETDIETISDIAENSGLEVEVFCHGALCICYSGQCQLSRSIGGRSANRGECAQPCRLAYRDEKGRQAHFLSPKDLCTVDLLPELAEAGVSSLKIEGRMKSPEYTAVVTSIYRKYLDMCMKSGDYEVDPQDKLALQQIFSRSGFTEGYFHGLPKNGFINRKIPGHTGIYAGKVAGSGRRGIVTVRAEEELRIGDGIEIRGSESTGGRVTYLKPQGKSLLAIGDFKGSPRPGDKVFRTSDAEQLKAARASYEKLGRRKSDAKMHFTAHEGCLPELSASCLGAVVFVQGSDPVSRAKNKPTLPGQVKKQLSKTGGTPFSASSVSVDMDESLYIPVSSINDMRRKALDLLEDKLSGGRKRPAVTEIRAVKTKPLHEKPEDIFELPPVTYGKCDEYIRAHFNEFPENIMVENMGWIREFLESGHTVYGGAGLNVLNGYARESLESLGVKICALSREADEDPDLLMITEYPVHEGILTDRKGKKYEARRSKYGDKTEIRPLGSQCRR